MQERANQVEVKCILTLLGCELLLLWISGAEKNNELKKGTKVGEINSVHEWGRGWYLVKFNYRIPSWIIDYL